MRQPSESSSTWRASGISLADKDPHDRTGDLARIEAALVAAADLLEEFHPGSVASRLKSNHDPVTEADLALDRLLRDVLIEEEEGWLSEETRDNPDRLGRNRVWVVDPLDGTKEFVAGIPEWCVAIGLVEDGVAVAGGVLNPARRFLALGAEGKGCTLNGLKTEISASTTLSEARILASRSEVNRGEWAYWVNTGLKIRPMGSVAYKLAQVACGLADATWTSVPKNEWDVAAGVALVTAAGGRAVSLDGSALRFNRVSTLFPGLIASGEGLLTDIEMALGLRTTWSPGAIPWGDFSV
ncbi:MAG: 3'(2'),5'-bisphosphate nucleotidase CysQ [Acidimicrobiia bacterium]